MEAIAYKGDGEELTGLVIRQYSRKAAKLLLPKHKRIRYDYMYVLRCHRPEDIDQINFKIEPKRPPNFAAIEKVFPDCHRPGVLFAFGDTIFNPWDVDIRRSLVAHECTHMLQQREIGSPETWWEKYLESIEFRFQQELDAHRIEYRDFLAQGMNRHSRRREFKQVSQRLASPLYNHMVTLSAAEKYIAIEIEDGTTD